jgi:hypothetical protein
VREGGLPPKIRRNDEGERARIATESFSERQEEGAGRKVGDNSRQAVISKRGAGE